MRHTFACAWRPMGYCAANYKLQYEGLNSEMTDKKGADRE